MTVLITGGSVTAKERFTSCSIYIQIRMVKVDTAINDPCGLTGTVTISNAVYAPGDQSRFNYGETGAERNDPVWFNDVDRLIRLQTGDLLIREMRYKPAMFSGK